MPNPSCRNILPGNHLSLHTAQRRRKRRKHGRCAHPQLPRPSLNNFLTVRFKIHLLSICSLSKRPHTIKKVLVSKNRESHLGFSNFSQFLVLMMKTEDPGRGKSLCKLFITVTMRVNPVYSLFTQYNCDPDPNQHPLNPNRQH
jgi:hypothetical protein